MLLLYRATLAWLALLATSIVQIAALQCYSCEGRESEMCGRNPTAARIVTCATNEMCNVLRTERAESFGGRTVTISRGCRQSAFAGAVAGQGVATTSQSCSSDLCNSGNGFGPGFGNQNDGIQFPGFPSFPQFPTDGFSDNNNNNHLNNNGGFNQQPHSNNNQYRPQNSAACQGAGGLVWILPLSTLTSFILLRL